jgi:hypothetical protein
MKGNSISSGSAVKNLTVDMALQSSIGQVYRPQQQVHYIGPWNDHDLLRQFFEAASVV